MLDNHSKTPIRRDDYGRRWLLAAIQSVTTDLPRGAIAGWLF